MKRIITNLSDNVLSKNSYRSKIDIINLCLNYTKFAPYAFGEEITEGNCILHIDKMRRLFIYYGNCIHSIHFPFPVQIKDKKLEFYYCDRLLDARTTSLLLEFFAKFDELETMEDMYEIFLKTLDEYELQDNYNENFFWKLICHMLIFEPAYLRYDEDFSERMNQTTHPAYHFDINYCNTSTFKLGLTKQLKMDECINILDLNKVCNYITFPK